MMVQKERYLLSKKFRFETAHRLAKNYVGKCANIHGHSWNGSITVSIPKLDKYGMGVDFGYLGKFCKHIEGMLDHKLLLYRYDPTFKTLIDSGYDGGSIMLFDDNPTSEVLAKWIFEMAKTFFKNIEECSVDNVTVEETCTSKCDYYG